MEPKTLEQAHQTDEKMAKDYSEGYEAIADQYIAVRSQSGADIITKWADELEYGSTVIDIGAGHGDPVTSALVASGHSIFAIDASPKMIAALKQQFPQVHALCEPFQTSSFFDQKYDGAVAVGLIFLLSRDDQSLLISQLANILEPGGRLLFSAPYQTGKWQDLLTGEQSLSLGRHKYRSLLRESGFSKITEADDANGTHYFMATYADV